MQSGRNYQGHIWLLSGTSEGPAIAKALIANAWKVTVTVVSFQASLAYEGISLDELKIGPLKGTQGIERFIKESELLNKKFAWVVDATHPFAELISSSLQEACKKLDQPLLRFERPLEDNNSATFINSFRELAFSDLNDQRLLMAIGSRNLKEAVDVAQESGAKVFARVLPTPESLRNALATSLDSNDLALVRPNLEGTLGNLELALCDKWAITGVLCRQSGGPVEKLWRKVTQEKKLKLWLISRPTCDYYVEKIYNCNELIMRLLNKKII